MVERASDWYFDFFSTTIFYLFHKEKIKNNRKVIFTILILRFSLFFGCVCVGVSALVASSHGGWGRELGA